MTTRMIARPKRDGRRDLYGDASRRHRRRRRRHARRDHGRNVTLAKERRKPADSALELRHHIHKTRYLRIRSRQRSARRRRRRDHGNTKQRRVRCSNDIARRRRHRRRRRRRGIRRRHNTPEPKLKPNYRRLLTQAKGRRRAERDRHRPKFGNRGAPTAAHSSRTELN